MAYKKYIKRDGKLYGPYIYHSRKEGGRVITEYHGKFENEKKYLPVGIFLALLLIFSFGYFFVGSDSFQNFSFGAITGLAVSDNLEEVVLEQIDPTAIIRFVIEIIAAEHLDKNREFISDIYEQTKELDDVWTEEIKDGEYVRVTFEENLMAENIITYFENVSGSPRIEIEERENYFYLKVNNGSLKLDFVGGKS